MSMAYELGYAVGIEKTALGASEAQLLSRALLGAAGGGAAGGLAGYLTADEKDSRLNTLMRTLGSGALGALGGGALGAATAPKGIESLLYPLFVEGGVFGGETSLARLAAERSE